MTSLVWGRRLFTHLQTNGFWHELDNGAAYVEDGMIRKVGDFHILRARHPDATVVGSPRHVVLPGFINAHHHVGLTPVQLGNPDLPLELWLVERLKSRVVDPYLDTAYSAFEMVASGVTTVQHIRAGGIGTIEDAERAAHAILSAYDDIGMRVSFCFSARDQNRLLYADDAAFTASLPTELQDQARWHFSRFAAGIDEYLDLFAKLRHTYRANEKIALQLAPANLHWCSDETLQRFGELSRTLDVPMHVHLLETLFQQEYGLRRSRKGAFHQIEQLGLAGPQLTIGHGVWVTDDDIARIADTRTHVCHNCSSNFRLRSGVAPLNRYRAEGVNVALGIDEAGINDDRDMLQEMRLVLNAHRTPGLDPATVPTTDAVLHMATAGGAATTSFGARIGELAVGKAADLVLIDFDRIAFPFLDPDTRVLDAILHRATKSDVDVVMVGGEVIFENGRFLRIDRDAVLNDLQTHMKRAVSADEAAGRIFANRVMPHVCSFYQRYLKLGGAAL